MEEMIYISTSFYDKSRFDLKESRDSTKMFVDSCYRLNIQIEQLENRNLNLLEDSLRSQQLLVEFDSLKKQREFDSLVIENYKSKLLDMQWTIDNSLAKYANGRLYFKYDAERINKCLDDYKNIESESVRKDFKQLPNLLENYGFFSEQLKQVLNSAQNDPDRKAKNKADEYKSRYINDIKRLTYFSDYYIKRKTEKWSIPYLNNIIDIALSILNEHDPGHYDYANFLPLIKLL